jgi:hypothetical protein
VHPFDEQKFNLVFLCESWGVKRVVGQPPGGKRLELEGFCLGRSRRDDRKFSEEAATWMQEQRASAYVKVLSN